MRRHARHFGRTISTLASSSFLNRHGPFIGTRIPNSMV